jgi:aryl-alcohol dehydrogenase-like predicted oxidoreductase
MQTVILGRTGLSVGVAALGAGGHSRLGQSRGASFEQSADLVRQALDLGVTLIDTAAGYGTEAIVGAGIRGHRDQVVISTKATVHRPGTPSAGTEGLIDATELRQRLQASLTALGTDHVDLYHLHGVTPDQYPHCREVLAPALARFRDEGLIRFACITERFSLDPRHRMLEAALRDDLWDVVMCGYNYLNQTAAGSVLPAAQAGRVGTLCMYAVRGPLGSAEGVRRLVARLIEKGEVDPASVDAADPLGFVTEAGIGLAEAAYRFCRHAPGMDVVITGTGDAGHLRQNISAIEAGPQPAEVADRLRTIFATAWSETGEP